MPDIDTYQIAHDELKYALDEFDADIEQILEDIRNVPADKPSDL